MKSSRGFQLRRRKEEIKLKLWDKLAKLIDVKSIMTLLLTVTFCILAMYGKVNSEQFLTVYAVIVSFFFGTKNGQRIAEEEHKER